MKRDSILSDTALHVPAPRTEPDWHALYEAATAITADLERRLIEWRDEDGTTTFTRQRIDAALRGEDE